MFGFFRQNAQLETKSIAGPDGRTYIEGYAAIFGTPDLSGDIIVPGAFAKSLERSGGELPYLWQHDLKGPVIGRVVELAEDTKGLRYKARLSRTQFAADLGVQVADGDVDGASFGYFARRSSGAKGARTLLEVDIFEVSLVSIPMHPDATAQLGAKGMRDIADALKLLAEAGYLADAAVERAAAGYDTNPPTEQLSAAWKAEMDAFRARMAALTNHEG